MHKIKEIAGGLQTQLNVTSDLVLIAVIKKIWFISDRLMIQAYDFLKQHPDRFTQLSEYEGLDARLTEAMLLEHMPAVVLDLLNQSKYLPELIVINIGMSEFSRFSNSQQRANIKYMVQACKALIQQVERQSNNFKGIFLSLMISLPWYINNNLFARICT